MANKKNHRRFGLIRKLPSGRYQASYIAPDGLRRLAPETFTAKADASAWLTLRESELLRGEWIDPALGKVTFGEYASRWLDERGVAETTWELYETLLRLHLRPLLGDRELGRITTETVRTWRKTLLDSGASPTTAAKAYRLLRAIMSTAVDDNRIRRNPCRIAGADKEHAPERSTASVGQVYDLADAMPARFRVLVLAGALTSLRWGELIGLRRCDVDLARQSVRVTRRLAQLRRGPLVSGRTKSAAGIRTVSVPAILVPELVRHLADFVEADPEALVFVGPKGAALRRSNWRESVKWSAAVRTAGLPEGFHFHDLRHTGNQLAAESGATTKELMHRMGHGSVRAAMIYQHATDKRDRAIADAVSLHVNRERTKGAKRTSSSEGGERGGRSGSDEEAAG